ncbi:two-component system sensor histidine kinase NtrB [Pyxidicoccus xibeiensis]|uniref:two-component system sensor histidine kinase NtrB n=1 Tax=Pyxidicoccus xibeiensis TaxID=2906759 RepID=UPI0020A80DC6|nr:ATP-binding protein [Pyxidicoccus xibeiensis]MCP3137680.1 ATP-binding protein [Pyxidicoccus xibeiensis]
MRYALLPILLLCAALTSVGMGVLTLLERNRAALAHQFAVERQAQLDEATRGVTEALEDVGEDLRFAGELMSQPGTPAEHRRELRALLEAVGQYKVIVAYDAAGTERLRLLDRRSGRQVSRGAVLPQMAEAARRSLQRVPGDITTSPPLGESQAWLRVMATALPVVKDRPAGAVAVLVDTESFFAPLRIVTSDPEARLLLVGSHGQVTSASDATLADWHRRLETDAALVPGFASLAERMKQGLRGSIPIREEEAERLGLGKAEAVAVFTPIRVRGGSHWSAATLVSTATLRSHEQGLIWRLSGAALLVALFLVTFAVYVVVAQRRKAALRESRRHAHQLAHLHDKTQKILDHIPAGVLALTEDGRISAVNQVLRARMPASAVGAPLAAAFPQAPEPVVARLRALVEAATSESLTRSLLGEPLALFGEEGRFNLHAVPLEAREPDVRTLLVVEDLSNVRALETQLLRAEKLATVGVLAAGIAHEIGTPLGVVRGRAEYVLGKLGQGHPQGAGVAVIIEQIDRVSRTLRQLLDFSRLQPTAVRPVALGPIARDVYELLRLEAERRRVSLELDVPDTLPPVAADPDQLQQVLVNLALNACDACGDGGRVRLSASASDGAAAGTWGLVSVTVRDNGCGIPKESLNQVFDPFFTTKKRGQGTGLGLTMVAHVVRNHGGRLELESEPGQGTCVTVLWPAATPAVEERHAS